MKRNPYYRLKYFADIPYLTCFGQANADFKHDYRLDETGAFLWEHLEETSDIKELTDCCAAHFQCPAEQYVSLEKNIATFINFLYQAGILLPENHPPQLFSQKKILKIAGLYCAIHSPWDIFPQEFSDFAVTEDISTQIDVQQIYIQPTAPLHTENGQLILRNAELSIIDGPDRYILFFPAFRYVKEAHMSKDGDNVTVYCTTDVPAQITQELNYTIRLVFMYFAQMHQMVMIHSSSILYRDRVWLFSGPSGTGKSTHTDLWRQLCNTPVINGDLNLVTVEQGIPVVHGIPWCGTSGIYDTKTYPLGGVIFLKQGAINEVIPLSDDQKQLWLLHRTPSPAWTATGQDRNHHVITELYDRIFICQLSCTPDEQAVATIKNVIDSFIDNK